jgi:hypothetical protein
VPRLRGADEQGSIRDRRHHLPVRIFFDESGDYAFPLDRFDCYVQAAVVCPESALPAAEGFVRDRCAAWGLKELHAHRLSATQLQEVAEFLSDMPIELCAQLTDTVLTTSEVIHSCRLDQAAAYQRSIDNYRRSGGRDPEVMANLQAQIKKAGLASQIPDGEFVQATLLVDGTVHAIQRARCRSRLWIAPGAAWPLGAPGEQSCPRRGGCRRAAA